MAYKKIKAHEMQEAELRAIWEEEYCKAPIITFDNVVVRCYADQFDHLFFESSNRRVKDKAILSYNRLEKIYWIKEALQDPDAVLKKGWDNDRKEYFKDRRVAIVKGNYVVIIRFTGKLKAKITTAYEKDDITNIMASEDFDKDCIYLKV